MLVKFDTKAHYSKPKTCALFLGLGNSSGQPGSQPYVTTPHHGALHNVHYRTCNYSVTMPIPRHTTHQERHFNRGSLEGGGWATINPSLLMPPIDPELCCCYYSYSFCPKSPTSSGYYGNSRRIPSLLQFRERATTFPVFVSTTALDNF